MTEQLYRRTKRQIQYTNGDWSREYEVIYEPVHHRDIGLVVADSDHDEQAAFFDGFGEGCNYPLYPYQAEAIATELVANHRKELRQIKNALEEVTVRL